MKKNLVRAIAIVAIFVCGSLIGTPLLALAQSTTFWTSSIPMTITEPLVVKSGTTVLPNGYVFQAVSISVGATNVKTITVTNTGAIAFLVKPVAASPSPDVTAVWTNQAGVSIAAGASADFVLTLTGINANASVSVPISFTRE